VTSSRVMEKGLEHDRRWMLVDENGVFITQRVFHRMALFKLHPQNGSFIIHHEGDSMLMPDRPEGGTNRKVVIWDDTVEVLEAQPEVHAWFSKYLGLNCRLVAFPEENTRPVDPDHRLAEENVSLADGYPLLVIGQASLDDLNHRLEKPVPMNRFRPNLVFTGGNPFEEDSWKRFTVGTQTFMGVKPCARCVLTTVDQETGVKGREPLLTLSRYRREQDQILFGQNVIPIDRGQIREGDEIVVD
jgi:uncharacterized protein YcbX